MDKEVQIGKLQKKERLYRIFGITLVVIGGLLFLRFLLMDLQATRLPVPEEMILAIAIFIFLIPVAGTGVLLLLRARRLKREIQEIYNAMGINNTDL